MERERKKKRLKDIIMTFFKCYHKEEPQTKKWKRKINRMLREKRGRDEEEEFFTTLRPEERMEGERGRDCSHR